MAFRGCPLCGATVRDDLIARHRAWHDELQETLEAPAIAELELEPWPAPAEPEPVLNEPATAPAIDAR